MPVLNRTEVRLDLTAFHDAVRFVYDNTQRDLPDIITRAALVSLIGGAGVIGAMKRTPKAAREAILGVPEKKVAGYVMNKHRGEKLTRSDVKRLVRKEYRRRVAAIGYTANVGWNKAVIALGGRGIGSHATGRGYATLGWGKPADGSQWPMFMAEMVNSTPAAQAIGEQPLQDALDDTARDMVQFVEAKMQEICNTMNIK